MKLISKNFIVFLVVFAINFIISRNMVVAPGDSYLKVLITMLIVDMVVYGCADIICEKH
jgi:hypothetical protein